MECLVDPGDILGDLAKTPINMLLILLAELKKKKNGFTYVDDDGKLWTGDNAIAKSMGMTSTEFRTELGICKNERRAYNVATAKALQKDGLGVSEIARQMSQRLGKNINESTVRSWFNEDAEKI